MKRLKLLFSTACLFCATAAVAQVDFNSPQYAKWGDTAEAREKNMLNSNFLKEEINNRNYNAAAYYFQELVKNCPAASVSVYQRGVQVYRAKIARAKSVSEKKALVDSLMTVHDLRIQYFGNDPKQGRVYILDQKARDYLRFLPGDRAGIREKFREAVDAGGASADPETIVAYFVNLCDDYKNTDEVMPDELLAEYERLLPILEENPDATELKSQFDASFGMSGAASCDNLEKLFARKLAATPDDETVLGQAVGLMTRAKCSSDFYFETAEKYYAVKPSATTAMFLAMAFQNKEDYVKAAKYLNEALAVENDPVEKQKLLARLSLVELAANHISGAAAAAREARELNPEDGVPYFVLAQCYATTASQCGGFSAQTVFWVAYDTMSKAINLLGDDSEYAAVAKQSLGAYRANFPTSEECFFNEVKEGSSYTVSCGLASGVSTVVRVR